MNAAREVSPTSPGGGKRAGSPDAKVTNFNEKDRKVKIAAEVVVDEEEQR